MGMTHLDQDSMLSSPQPSVLSPTIQDDTTVRMELRLHCVVVGGGVVGELAKNE